MSHHFVRSFIAVALLCSSSLGAHSVRAAEVIFSRDVAPILVARCVSCHTGQKARGDYRLHTFQNLMEPGNSDAKPIVAGKPDTSELYRRLASAKASEQMPPGDDPLSPAETAIIRQWIAAGATYDKPDRALLLRAILPPRAHPPSPNAYPMASPVFALAFSPDGQELYIGGINEVLVRNASTGKLIRRLGRLPARIQTILPFADGKKLIVAGGTVGEYGEVAVVDSLTGERLRVLGTFDDIVLAAKIAPDGKSVVAGGADRVTRAFSIETGTELWRSALHSDWITGVAHSPDGRFIATSSRDRTVKVLEASTGKLFTTYNGHRRQYSPHEGQFAVYAVVFDPKGAAYSIGAGSAIRAWDPVKTRDENGSAADMEERFKNAGHSRYFDFPAGKPSFTLVWGAGQLFSAGGDKAIRQHDADNGKLVREFKGQADWIYSLAVHAGSGRLASGGYDGEIRLWDTKTGAGLLNLSSSPD